MSTRFKKDLKKFRHNKDKRAKIASVVEMLAQGVEIPSSMRPHKLIGNYAGHMELHIEKLDLWMGQNFKRGDYEYSRNEDRAKLLVNGLTIDQHEEERKRRWAEYKSNQKREQEARERELEEKWQRRGGFRR